MAVSELPVTQAFALPVIRLTAVAPPPEKARALFEALSDTEIAIARDVASIPDDSSTETRCCRSSP